MIQKLVHSVVRHRRLQSGIIVLNQKSESENVLFGLDKNIHKFNVSRRRERKKKIIFKTRAHTKTILCRYRVGPWKENKKKQRSDKERREKEERKKEKKNILK